MDSSSFIVCVRTEYIYKDIVKDGEKRFNTSNYELVRPLQNEKKSHRFNERWIRWKIMKEFVGLRTKTYSYLTDDNDKVKKQKVQKLSYKEKS